MRRGVEFRMYFGQHSFYDCRVLQSGNSTGIGPLPGDLVRHGLVDLGIGLVVSVTREPVMTGLPGVFLGGQVGVLWFHDSPTHWGTPAPWHTNASGLTAAGVP